MDGLEDGGQGSSLPQSSNETYPAHRMSLRDSFLQKETAPQRIASERNDEMPTSRYDSEPVTNSNIPPISAAPDGGIQAWLQVTGAWLIIFNVLGILNSYGQFQTIYERQLLVGMSSSSIAWIGSVQTLVCYLVGILSGPLFDKGYLRYLMITGTLVAVFGITMLSLCQKYYQFFFASATIGLGFGCLFIPASAIVPHWFSKKSALAVGISATGSSIGAVIYPIILNQLHTRIGFGWTVRIMGLMVLVLMVPPTLILKHRLPRAPKGRPLVDLMHFKDKAYSVMCIGLFLGFCGLYVFYYFLQLYAIDVANTAPSLAFYLLAIINAGSFFGRLIPNYIAIYFGAMNTQISFVIVASALSFCLIAIKDTTGVIVFSGIYGFVSGPFVSLPINILAQITEDKSTLGIRLGMGFAFIGVGVLIGEPLAGAILGSNQNWTGVSVWTGVMLFASVCCTGLARMMKTGFVLRVIY